MDKQIIDDGMAKKEIKVRLKSSPDDLIEEGIDYKKLDTEIPLWIYIRLYQKGFFEQDFLLMLAKSYCDAEFLKEVITLENKKEIEIMQRLIAPIFRGNINKK